MSVNSTGFDEYEQFLAQFPIKQYAKGEVLMSPDENPEHVFFLQTGKVSKYDVTKYGERVVMNVFTRPILFPLSWVLNRTINRYYYEAVLPVTVRCIPLLQAEAYLQSNPAVVYKFLQEVYAGLEDTQRRVVHLTRGTARSQLMFELLFEARRSGKLQKDGSCVITISATEIGQRAGLSRETISRELAKILRSDDLYRRRGRSIVIRDVEELDQKLRVSI